MLKSVNHKAVFFDSSWSVTSAEPEPTVTVQSSGTVATSNRVAPLLTPQEMRHAYVTGLLQGAGLPHAGSTRKRKRLLTTGLLVLGGWAANKATNGLAVPLLTATGGVIGGKRMLSGHSTLQEARRECDPEKAKVAWTMLGQGTPGVANFAAAVPGATNRWVRGLNTKSLPNQLPRAQATKPGESAGQYFGSLSEQDPLAILGMDKPPSSDLPAPVTPVKSAPNSVPEPVAFLGDLDIEAARARLELMFEGKTGG